MRKGIKINNIKNAKTGKIRATKPFLPMNLYNIYKN